MNLTFSVAFDYKAFTYSLFIFFWHQGYRFHMPCSNEIDVIGILLMYTIVLLEGTQVVIKIVKKTHEYFLKS